jgi:hypothetical protein
MSDTFKSLEGYEGLSPVDKFGKLLMQNLRDRAIDYYVLLVVGHWQGYHAQGLHRRLQSLSEEQRQLLLTCLIEALDTGIHDFLFKLQEQADFENSIQVLVDGTDIIAASDGLHGESYGDEGWIARFSKYKTKY